MNSPGPRGGGLLVALIVVGLVGIVVSAFLDDGIGEEGMLLIALSSTVVMLGAVLLRHPTEHDDWLT